jgi:hypothetical protein
VILVKPTLRDLLFLCEHARADEIEQYEAIVAKEWNPEAVAADLYARSGISLCLFDKATGVPVMAGGWDMRIDGVWAGWMVGTDAGWATHWRSVTKATRRMMQLLLDRGERRLQIVALESREKTCEWYARGLKMEREGQMKAYGFNGENAVMYARTRGP